jgi:hypothetical protein
MLRDLRSTKVCEHALPILVDGVGSSEARGEFEALRRALMPVSRPPAAHAARNFAVAQDARRVLASQPPGIRGDVGLGI